MALMVLIPAACQSHEASANRQEVAPRALVGQLLMPPGTGSRGVEVVATLVDATGERRDVWLLFDEQGRFAHSFQGEVVGVAVSTGLRAPLHNIGPDELSEVNEAGEIVVGVIDLRDQLTRHRLLVRAAEGKPSGDVRMAMFFGPPPVGPSGEPVSLGSRQFPPIALASEVEWLLPLEAEPIYFLVERPIVSDRGLEWRGGDQRRFGPFALTELPNELVVD